LAKAFASQADTSKKRITFAELAKDRAYAYTAEGDPNTGIVIGDDGVMVIDAQATPLMARDVIAKVRAVTAKPIKYVVLTHYHAVRVLGASAYGADHIIASQDTRDLIVERGEQDMASEIGRFPRLFEGAETIPGLTWPTLTFKGEMTLYMGKLEVKLMQLGRGHTKGDTIVWLPREEILFSGDLVEYGATPYAGDAYLGDWPKTLERLEALRPRAVVPGRGDALTTPQTIKAGIDGTRAFVRDMFESVKAGAAAGKPLKAIYEDAQAALRPKYGSWVIFDHCLPFDVVRAYDEARGVSDPNIWTDKRDQEMWAALEG
jgi:glyoxylase-like metal-dependent hydrolase (beta-lactamase superfamily II)